MKAPLLGSLGFDRMNLPRILIPAREYSGGDIYAQADSQRRTYLDVVFAHGGVPFICPLTSSTEHLEALLEVSDGVLLCGGEDIDPQLYGEKSTPQLGSVSRARDDCELAVVALAYKRRLPILGICRGIQLINVSFGGTLYQDLPSQTAYTGHGESGATEDWTRIVHKLILRSGTQLAAILGPQPIVGNSLHHQGINRLGGDLVVSGSSEDGLVEAVEVNDYPFLIGVQAHPETIWQKEERRWSNLFAAFISAAKHRSRP